MILQKLCEYYDRVDSDPTQPIAQHGFAPQKIAFEIVIEKDGTLFDLLDVRDTSGKKPVPVRMALPFEGRTSGVKAMFLWDKAEYLLGWVPRDLLSIPDDETEKDSKKRTKKIDRIGLCFEATKEIHESFASDIKSAGYQCLNEFFRKWQPAELSEKHHEFLENIGTGFGVFRLRSKTERIHEHKDLRKAWVTSQSKADEDGQTGICLVTGEEGPLAKLHPSVKGVLGAQTMGASVVSFNDDAFTSFDKKQSLNSPVSEIAAFKYTTALNWLLEKDRGRKLTVGDTTCVFWAEGAPVLEDIFNFGLDPQPQEDNDKANEVGSMLRRIVQGEAQPPSPGTNFYVLGLSPNAARLSIRFWISSTAGELIERVAEHQRRMEIVRSARDGDLLPLWLVLAQTARESKDIAPLLGGAILRSVLTGTRYPESLLAALIRRVRAEQEIRHPKAAIIKAILNHNHQMGVTVMLDTERSESSYQLGRLFASLERAQEDALPGLNATIKDRYFGAASSTPSTVFPRLIRLSQHHIRKLEGGRKVVAEKRLQEIMGRIDAFPTHLNLADQGLFSIGYYHQRQDFYTKKEDKAAAKPSNE